MTPLRRNGESGVINERKSERVEGGMVYGQMNDTPEPEYASDWQPDEYFRDVTKPGRAAIY